MKHRPKLTLEFGTTPDDPPTIVFRLPVSWAMLYGHWARLGMQIKTHKRGLVQLSKDERKERAS